MVGTMAKIDDSVKKKVPELRFKGFTDDWEERKLGELGSVAMNRRIFKDQTSENEEVPFFKIGTFGSKPDAFISRELFEEYKLKYPYPEIGDILISASGSIGRTVVYQGEDEYFQDSNIVWLKHDNRLDNKFLKQFYSIVKWQGLEGSTIKRLYNKNILDTDISIPSTIEQNKIGMFFEQLDNTITLHQRKLDLLKEQKKGYLQKMFPKNGEKIPELRFAGFVDDWEQRKLGEMLVNLEAGVSVNSSDYDTGYFILKTSAIKMGNIDLLEVKSIVSEEVARAKTPLIKNSIIISRMNTPELVGASGLVRESIDNIFLPDRLWQGQVAGNFSPEWLIQSINIAANIKKIRDLATGTSGSMKNISKKSMLDLIINVPTLEEQQKIGSFFKQLDDVIALHQRKLDLLKEQKKGFLQKMFV